MVKKKKKYCLLKNITKIWHIKSGIYKQKIESFPEVTASSNIYGGRCQKGGNTTSVVFSVNFKAWVYEIFLLLNTAALFI